MRNWIIEGQDQKHKGHEGILRELEPGRFTVEYSDGNKFNMTIDNFYDDNGNPHNEAFRGLLYFSNNELVWL